MTERFLTEDGLVPGYDEEGNALMADSNCCCTTAADLGFSGWGDGVNPNLIANVHPECPIHGVVRVPRDLWAKVRNIPSDRLPTGTWEAIQAIGREGSSE